MEEGSRDIIGGNAKVVSSRPDIIRCVFGTR